MRTNKKSRITGNVNLQFKRNKTIYYVFIKLYCDCSKCAPAALSVALSVPWPEHGKLRFPQIFVVVFLVERVLDVEV